MTRRARAAAGLVRLAAAIDALPIAKRAVYLLGAVHGLDYPRIGSGLACRSRSSSG